MSSKAKIIYDLCDAVWLPHFQPLFKDIHEILRNVDSVTWDYRYTKEFVQNFNRNTYYWGPASQVEFYDHFREQKRMPELNKNIVIGWIGSESTVFNLYSIWEVLESLFEKYPNLKLKILGAGSNPGFLPNFEKVRYSFIPNYTQTQMIKEVFEMDIGLFPLFNTEDSRVRGYLKALVYMSGEVAVVASPRGVVSELITDGINGMLADSNQEWLEKLQLLILNEELRRKIALSGLETAKRDFNLKNSFNGLLKAIEST